MSDEPQPPHHHSLRERLDAAEAAADEVVAEDGGQLGGEVDALAVPFEEIAAAVRAAIHPDHVTGSGHKGKKVADSAADPDAQPPA